MSQLKQPTFNSNSNSNNNSNDKPLRRSPTGGGYKPSGGIVLSVVESSKKQDDGLYSRQVNGASSSPNIKLGLNAGAPEFIPKDTQKKLNPTAPEFVPGVSSLAPMTLFPYPLQFKPYPNYPNPKSNPLNKEKKDNESPGNTVTTATAATTTKMKTSKSNPLISEKIDIKDFKPFLKGNPKDNSTHKEKLKNEINNMTSLPVLELDEENATESKEPPIQIDIKEDLPVNDHPQILSEESPPDITDNPNPTPSDPQLLPKSPSQSESNPLPYPQPEPKPECPQHAPETPPLQPPFELEPLIEAEPEIEPFHHSYRLSEDDKISETLSDTDINEADKENVTSSDESIPETVIKPAFFPISKLDSTKIMYSREYLLQFKKKFTDKPSNMLELSELCLSKDDKNKSRSKQSPKNPQRSGQRQQAQKKTKTKATRKGVFPKANGPEDEVSKKFLSILNKLTPETYPKLFNQLKEIDISKEANCSKIVNIIYSKAIHEPRYCELYAKLCSDIVKSSTEATKVFRQHLLNCCQKSFENKPVVPEISPDLPDLQKMELEEMATKIRIKNLGNIKFTGELFKLAMLQEKIMFYCLDSLLTTKSETDLEHFCMLLTTIGKLLDKEDKLEKYFVQINQLTEDNSVIPRIKYLLMGMIDLRAQKWVPRRVVDGPKTIKDIHDQERREREKQQQSKGKEQQQHQKPLPSPSPKIPHRDSSLKPGLSAGGRGKPINLNVKIEPSIFQPGKLRTRNTTQNSPRLHKSDSGADLDRSSETLSKSSSEIKRLYSDSQENSVDSQLEELPTLSRANSYTDEDVVSKTKSVIKDYIEEESIEDAVESLKSYLNSPSAPCVMISNILSFAFEKKDGERKLIAELLTGLGPYIATNHFEKAFDEILSLLTDLIYDIPKAGDYMGYFLAHAIISKCLAPGFMVPEKLKIFNITPIIAEALLAQCFKTINQKDPILLINIFSPFMESIQFFLKDGNKERFFKSNEITQLQSLIDLTNPSTTASEPKKDSEPNSPDLSDETTSPARRRVLHLSTASEIVTPSQNELQKSFKLPKGRGRKLN